MCTTLFTFTAQCVYQVFVVGFVVVVCCCCCCCCCYLVLYYTVFIHVYHMYLVYCGYCDYCGYSDVPGEKKRNISVTAEHFSNNSVIICYCAFSVLAKIE